MYNSSVYFTTFLRIDSNVIKSDIWRIFNVAPLKKDIFLAGFHSGWCDTITCDHNHKSEPFIEWFALLKFSWPHQSQNDGSKISPNPSRLLGSSDKARAENNDKFHHTTVTPNTQNWLYMWNGCLNHKEFRFVPRTFLLLLLTTAFFCDFLPCWWWENK